MNDAAARSAESDESSVPGLWQSARWLLRWLLSVCGTPCEIVERGLLTRTARRDILHWLRPVEALARRLLAAEAAAAAKTLPPLKRRGRRPAPPPFCRIAFLDPEDSTRWVVRFSVCERTRGRRASPARQRNMRPAPHPWPLALRIAAVWRVIDDPAPFARRLARRLERLGEAEIVRLRHACRPPPERPPGTRPRLGESSVRQASARALAAVAAFDTG